MVQTGIELIQEERQRQIAVEGWTPAHDDAHVDREMISAAVVYANCGADAQHSIEPMQMRMRYTAEFPWTADWFKPSEDPIRNLVKAGALIAAEIDRLQRLEVPHVQ